MPTAAAVQEAKSAQAIQSKRATFEKLRSKRRIQKEFSIVLGPGEDPVSFLFGAIGAQAYDRLITKCPPSVDQRAEGAAYDQNKFAPLLLAAVSVEPVLDASEWGEIWNSEDWNRGEISAIFYQAVNLCNEGLDVNPIEAV